MSTESENRSEEQVQTPENSPEESEAKTEQTLPSDDNVAEADDVESETSEDIERDPLEAALAERDELKDQTLRALAEVDNMRRRTERELQNARKYGHLSFARDLLTSIDNLSQAVALAPADREGLDDGLKNLLIGVEMIHTELRSVLERHNIVQINPKDEKFDYNLHQAMFEVPTNEVEPGHVVQVAQLGYKLHDRLLRPAMVGVSKAVEPASSDAGTGADE